MSEPRERCGAMIEREWPGHRVVLSRRYCKAWPLRGFEHCRHHLSFKERDQMRDDAVREAG